MPIVRRPSRRLHVGPVEVGGGAPVVVQSMTTTRTEDVEATLAEIDRLRQAGCELVRIAVPNQQAADAMPEVIRRSALPVITDIHFQYRYAIAAMEAGAAGVRINPGNIGSDEKAALVVRKARETATPIRIGVNSGSLERDLIHRAKTDPVGALVESALREIRLFEALDFRDFKVSIKSTSVEQTIAANRMLAGKVDYPLHLGVTEAGTAWAGSIKSAVGLGALLADGIGDTIRVSLVGDPVEEVRTAWQILRSLGLRQRGPVLIACPTCGRIQIEMEPVCREVEDRLATYDEHFEVAVMGCAVNGPGEAGNADFGIAGGNQFGFLYAHGKVLRKVPVPELVDELFKEIDAWLERGRVPADAVVPVETA
jgi:(E)-4-hydroxy-3-methylbut-2-enyl-diphosphate synthase